MNRAVLLVLLLLCVLPFLMGDMIILSNRKQYRGLIFSDPDDPVLKVMTADGESIYINRKHVKEITTEDIDNRADKVALAIVQDQLRIKERQYSVLKTAYDELLAEKEKLALELEDLRKGAGGHYANPEPGPYLRLLNHEVKYGMDSITISGILFNEGDAPAAEAAILVYLYDENGVALVSKRFSVTEKEKTIAVDGQIDFLVTEKVGRSIIQQLTSVKVEAANE